MKFNTAAPADTAKAYAFLQKIVEAKGIVDIKKVSPKRSLNQNSYLHLLLGAFGAHFGYTLEEAKIIYKELNADIYKYVKEIRGKKWEFYRSSADLTKEEMAKTIDNLHEWSKKGGYPLPPATDQEWLRQIENEVEQHRHLL